MSNFQLGDIARNDAGDTLVFNGSNWVSAQVAEHSDGRRLVNLGQGWVDPETAFAERSLPAEAGRYLGMMARSGLEGLGGVPALFTAPAAALLNKGNALLGGDPNYFGDGNIGTAAANALGLPKPETGGERVTSEAIKAMASVPAGFGVGAGLNAIGRAPVVAKLLQSALPAQFASSGAAGLSMGVAREKEAGPVGQTIAGLAGGMVPGLAAVGATRAWRGLGGAGRGFLDALDSAGQNRIAGQVLNKFAGDREAVLRALQRNADVEFVPGSLPTLAQATGDRGLSVLEKGLASSGMEGSAFQSRFLDQGAAQQRALQQGLSERAPYGGMLSADDVGTRIRYAGQQKLDEYKRVANSLYNDIDPDKLTRFNLEPLLEVFQQRLIDNGVLKDVPPVISRFMNRIKYNVDEGRTLPYEQVSTLNTDLGELWKASMLTKDGEGTARLAGLMKSDFDNYINVTSQDQTLMNTVPQAKKGSQLYKQATQYARERVGNDPYYEDLSYLMKRGLNLDAVHQVVGAEGVRELNKVQPGLVRKNGTLHPDTIGDSLAGGRAYGYGGDTPSGQELLDTLIDRLGPGRGRQRADMARFREEYLGNNAEGHTGLTSEGIEKRNIANVLWKRLKDEFKNDVNNDIYRFGTSTEHQKVPTDVVPSKYFTSGITGAEKIRGFNLAAGKSADARDAMRDYVVSQARNAASKPDGTLDFNRLTTWAKNHGPALEQLGYRDIANFPKVRADIARAKRAEQLAGVRGSPTAQNLATQAILDRFTGDMRADVNTGKIGTLGGSIARAIPNIVMKRLGQSVMQGPNEAVKRILIDASLDPQLARKLMQNTKYTPKEALSEIMKRQAQGYAGTAARLPGLLSDEYWK